LPGKDWLPQLAGADILCVNQWNASDEEIEGVRAFVERGGGLLISGLGWGWLQLNPGKTLDEHPGNRLIGRAGILWADGSVTRTGKEGFLCAPPAGSLLHASSALDEAGPLANPNNMPQIAATIRLALATLPPDDATIRPRVAAILAAAGGAAIPTAAKPLGSKDSWARFLLTLGLDAGKRARGAAVAANPAAKEFPGLVPAGAKPVETTIEVHGAQTGWIGTGLYANAGEPVEVTIAGTPPPGLLLRVGCHTDELWHHERWHRAPEVSAEFRLDARAAKFATPFGGLLYLENRRGGSAAITIRGAYAAPRFILGMTSAELWQSEIRARPAPWAELEAKNIILTVPAEAARALDDPTPLLQFWDSVADTAADFVVLRKRARPERFVADVQISAGYMHAGYPIMLPLGEVPNLIGVENLKKGTWGLFHELGHNHQDSAWTFEGAGEVTNNVIAMYILDTLCGAKPGTVWGGFDGIEKRVAAHIAKGAPFEEWKRDPAIALWMYKQLVDEFGWEPYKKVFAEYRDLPQKDKPTNEGEKRDQWLVRFSRACGKNLSPFFELWGVPTSESARASIAALPAWTPAPRPDK
jgi:hypothetical protein